MACVALATLFVICLIEILSRALFAHSSALVGEYSEYLLLSSLLLGSGWVLRQQGHIRVTLLTDRVPHNYTRAARYVTTSLALLVSGIASVAMTDFALGTLERGTLSYHPSATPLWIPQVVAAAGFWLLSLGLFAELVDPKGTTADPGGAVENNEP
ncbi:TRAP transporter small permease [Lentisalinibacter orientalis]|uniref:TRAP transporter small permease n=1 Tax=Lentisalinibacter orientalis TaxID=2992241 RepID=UPI0038639D33